MSVRATWAKVDSHTDADKRTQSSGPYLPGFPERAMKRNAVKATARTATTMQAAKTDTENGVPQPFTTGCASMTNRLYSRRASFGKGVGRLK